MIFAILHMKIKDMNKLSAYREQASAALAKHGGALVDAVAQPTVLQATIDTPDMAAVLSFPDRQAAPARRDNPELTNLHALRKSAGPGNIFLAG